VIRLQIENKALLPDLTSSANVRVDTEKLTKEFVMKYVVIG
jgi:hypothetical protein